MNSYKVDKKNVEDILGLTAMQEGMLFHYLSHPESKQYLEQIRLRFSCKSKINIQWFKQAWKAVCQTNEVLRSVIRWEKLDEPIQILLKNKEIPIRVLDLSRKNKKKQPVLLDKIIKDDRNEKIDLTKDPLRIILCMLNGRQGEMVITFHHILYDGWSNAIVLREFIEAYNRLANGKKTRAIQKTKYKEFFKWYQGQDKHEQREFWKSYLQGFDTLTSLPYDKTRLEDIRNVKTVEVEVTPTLKEQMDTCCQNHNLTVSTLIYTAWGLLLQKYNNSNDIIFGTAVSGRTPVLKGIDHIVGLFLNTLPLRLRAAKDDTILEIFHLTSSHLKERNAYEHSSFAEIKKLCAVGGGGDLFDSLIIIDNYPLNLQGNLSHIGNLTIHSYEIFEMTGFDLTWQILLFDHMKINLLYNEDLFEVETVKRLANHFINLVKGIVASASQKVSEIDMLSENEKKQILLEFNNSTVEYPADKTIQQLFREQAARTPLNQAVRFQDRWLTYRELNGRSDQLVHQLREYGVADGSKVVLMFPRSLDMIVGMLGILKANAACIPLDISYPPERLGFIIQDSQAKFLLKHKGIQYNHSSVVTGTGTVTEINYNMEDTRAGKYKARDPGQSNQPDSLSYMIYTSGSTGKPKAALLNHSGVINHAYTKIDVLEITHQDTVANNFSINFIASLWQVLAPIFIGAKVIVYREDIERDPYAQFERAASDGVTIIEVVPSIMKAYLYLLDEGKKKINLDCVRKIALTGEESKPSLVNRFYRTYHIPLVNCYGQTECSDDVLHYKIPVNRGTDIERVPIGKPAHNTQILILNHHNQLQPVGVIGEICVIGPGVAYGYWKRPELTAEKFIMPSATRGLFLKKPPPGPPQKLFIENARQKSHAIMQSCIHAISPPPHFPISPFPHSSFYRTGDLGRWLPDGNVEYAGRIDHQVKIRGNRVELREIENRVMSHDAVKEAVVIAREDREGEKNLYAFFVPDADKEITISEIRQYLLKTLPDYMIPAQFVPMEKLPLTPNGKIDRKTLLKTGIKGSIATGTAYHPPRNEFEKKIETIWMQLLDKEQIGINDNFFDLGGHSLLLIKLKSKLEKNFELPKEIRIIELFNYPTIAHQAQYIEENIKVKVEVEVKEKEKISKDLDYNYKLVQDTREPALDKSFCGGSRGALIGRPCQGLFSKRAPLVAVIGISLRIPGATNIHEFWKNLTAGTESISFFQEEELENSQVNQIIKDNANIVPAAGILGDIDLFAADFFGFNPREAEIMDPQQRLFLEHAWMALEDAGYVGDTYPGLIGVYAGTSVNKYLLNNVMTTPDVVKSLGEFQANIGNDKDFLATRVSYKLNLKGPALTVQTACSTSLVAIHLAKQGLLNGECDMALAGGAAVNVPEKSGYFYNEGGYLSPDGHCRPFDAGANGTVFSSGIGIVVLKQLHQALEDNDYIYAVIKGSAINNDGSLRVGYTSPGEIGQAGVIAKALKDAGVSPDTIGYVETHGTGTVLGDPVEIAALTRAFRAAAGDNHIKNQSCAIGSVKSNIGHLDTAAGVVGFIKTVLCLKHRQFPPSINIKSPNPLIDFPNTPFYVNQALADWPAAHGTPRRAGVSAFGIGGTNAHVILEEPPEGTRGLAPLFNEETSRKHQLILLSAKTETALKQTTRNLVNHLKQHPDISLADAAYTLNPGRKAFNHRLALVCRDSKDAIAALETFNPKRIVMHTRTPGDKSTVFMFPGVGEHYVNMAFQLYQLEPVFRKHADQCCDILEPLLEKDLRNILFKEKLEKTGETGKSETIDFRKLVNREEKPLSEEEKVLSQTVYSQTSIFVVEYALARLLMEWGIRPYAMIGYSIGEYTAACLSGVFSLEDALLLVARRAQLIHSIEKGAMLAISLPEKEILPLLPEDVSIAAINTPDLCIVSGKSPGIASLQNQLEERKAVFRRLKTFQAFHSPMMSAVRNQLTAVLENITLYPPKIPYISNVTGTWVTAEQVTGSEYWVTHTVSPIRFSAGICQLLNTSCNFFLEIGPGNSLCGFAAQHHYSGGETVHDRFVLASLPKESENVSDAVFLLRTLSKLWAAGLEIDWPSFYQSRSPNLRRVPLPTYPFERQRYWLEPGTINQQPQAIEVSRPLPTQPGSGAIAKKQNISQWFYLPYWKQSLAPPLTTVPVHNRENRESWLFFLDESDMGLRLIKELNRRNQSPDITMVKIGRQFEKHPGDSKNNTSRYSLNPGQYSDYEALLEDLRGQDKGIDKIVHLWQWTSPVDYTNYTNDRGFSDSPGFLDRGVYSLLYLVKAMAKLSMFDSMELWMVSKGLHRIESSDRGDPGKAAILGPCKVISQEYPNILSRSIDFQEETTGDNDEQRIAQDLVSQLISSPPERIVAYRGTNRWVRAFEPIKLEKGPGVPGILREKGVYLVTGGLGKIGLAIAQYLAQSVHAKLVLTSRSKPTEKGKNNPIVKKIKQLEEMGAQVLVVQADAADRQQMLQAVKQAEEKFGPIHGVLHAAGITGENAFKLIADSDRQDCELHFKPKIRGLMVLEQVFRDKHPDFCMLTSSLSPILGGLSFYAYSAANSFMDGFAQQQALVQGKNWLSINWADWERNGEEPTNETRANLVVGSTVAALNITPGEGKETFKRVLSLLSSFTNGNKIPGIIISSGDLHRRLQQWVLADPEPGKDDLKQVPHQRPQLQSIFEPPQNEAEKIIGEIWQELLGIEMVGVHDNFFELGGHSLIATKLISRLREIFRIDISLPTLFDRPTIREVADNIVHTWGDRETVEEIAKTYREVYCPRRGSAGNNGE